MIDVELSEDCFCVKCKERLKNGQSRYCIECVDENRIKYQQELRKRRGYISNYNKIRQSIFERDNFKCKMCRREFDLIVHHKDEDRQNNSESNLKTLCGSCHKKGHRAFLNFKEAYKRQPRNSKGRFGIEKSIGFIFCLNCKKRITKDNSAQKYCKKCAIKLDIGHRGKKRYGN